MCKKEKYTLRIYPYEVIFFDGLPDAKSLDGYDITSGLKFTLIDKVENEVIGFLFDDDGIVNSYHTPSSKNVELSYILSLFYIRVIDIENGSTNPVPSEYYLNILKEKYLKYEEDVSDFVSNT
ncbi:hypothetical protein [Yersinia ruckeri]|uniref:hypothetical protein n=1 Tax=Yersinia ruckeri TaxID=29486 RepID=UPI001F455487|nr:hypothetical protein [Yersinia ruckeri]UIM96973.1 hypothetical protein LGL89_13375 [Yersinia ruckeri]